MQVKIDNFTIFQASTKRTNSLYKFKAGDNYILTRAPGLLGPKNITQIEENSTLTCICDQKLYPFMNASEERIAKYVDINSFKSRSFSPRETGSRFYWIDDNKIVPQERLSITESQWVRYIKQQHTSPQNNTLVSRVENELRKFGLEDLIVKTLKKIK